MRNSQDEYLTRDGEIVSVSQDQQPPVGATIWNGYDYAKQEWIHNGKKDERTIAELYAAIQEKSPAIPLT